MRGEFIGVWSETWRWIWSEIAIHEAAPADLFCELYRELDRALKPPSTEAALSLVINDEILSKEAFEKALSLATAGLDTVGRQNAFDLAISRSEDEPIARKDALEEAVAKIIGDTTRSRNLWELVLEDIVGDSDKIKGLLERTLANTINDPVKGSRALEGARAEEIDGELKLVGFLESAHEILQDMGGDPLSNHYFNLLETFIAKFSLRYDLRRPCTLCPTLPGIFASLVDDLRAIANRDAHLDGLMRDFEDAVRDLRIDSSDRRIRICIQKQVNVLEAMGARCPGVTEDTLGAICKEVNTWPHLKVQEAMQSLYKFTCNYPGIRHAGASASALRDIDMRDMVAMSILLTGFTPYLTDQLNVDAIYRGQ